MSSGEVVRAVWGMQVRHPVPPSQREDNCRRHAADVRRFLEERGIGPRGGGKVGNSSWGTGLPGPVFAALAERLPVADRWQVTGMLVRRYWLSPFAGKTGG